VGGNLHPKKGCRPCNGAPLSPFAGVPGCVLAGHPYKGLSDAPRGHTAGHWDLGALIPGGAYRPRPEFPLGTLGPVAT
jgi:hypothetical protein